MARREWADKIVKQEMTGYHWNARIKKSTVILPDIAAKLLVKEHARAVRIVKADLAEVKRDQHNYSVVTKNELVKRLERLLVKLTKGRA